MSVKTCSKCKSIKPLDDFGNHKKATDGRQPACKECTNKRMDPAKRRQKEQNDLRNRLVWLSKEGTGIAKEAKKLSLAKARGENVALALEALGDRRAAFKDVVSATSAASKILLGGNGGLFDLPVESKRPEASSKPSITSQINSMQNMSILTDARLAGKKVAFD